jgi:hypothetical protein
MSYHFPLVRNPDFKSLCPKHVLIFMYHLEEHLQEKQYIVSSKRAKLKKFFKDSCQWVCLTTDGWTSKQLDSYMTVNASFIDDNCMLHKKVIEFFW